jgi:hypothetical protein
MISEIGLMVGFYIITRMVSFLMRKGERKENIVVYVLALITILITAFVIYDLFTRGAEASNILQGGV